MSRAEILAETLARLEAERYAPLPPRPPAEYAPVAHEEGLRNQRAMLSALSTGDARDHDADPSKRYDWGTSESGPDGASTPLPGPDPRVNSTVPRSEG